jgi:hypothetical protein
MPASPERSSALTAVLAEYDALRSEIAWLIAHGAQLQNYAIGLSLGAFPIATFVLQNSSAVFLIGLFLALPVGLSLLGLLYFRQHQEVYVVAAYIREEIRPIIRELTGRDDVWGWEEFKAARQERLSARSPIFGVWRPRTILLLRLAIFSLPAVCSVLIAIALAVAQGVHRIYAAYTTAGSAILLLFAIVDVFLMLVLGIRLWKEADLGQVVMDTSISAEPPAGVKADS